MDLPEWRSPAAYGLLGARPVASSLTDGSTYFATDDNGGTLYQVQAGAWAMIAPRGIELQRAEKTDAAPTTTNGIGSPVLIAGLSVTKTYRGLPVEISLSARGVKHSAAGKRVGVAILDGSGATLVNVFVPCATTTDEFPVPQLRGSPANLVVGQQYTFNAAFFAFDAGTATFVANVAASPAVLSWREL